MKSREVSLDLNPVEESDWGFARNKRIVLRRDNCEFSTSIYSVEVSGFVCPNRDYPFEGLLVDSGGEVWKFLDSIAFSLSGKNGEQFELKPRKTTAFLNKAVFEYGVGGSENLVSVEYYLHSRSKDPSLTVCFLVPKEFWECTLSVKPFVDLREINSPSCPQEHSASGGKNLIVRRGERALCARSPNLKAIVLQSEEQEWNYKLGSGNRFTNQANGCEEFVSEKRVLFCPGEMSLVFKSGEAMLQFSCGSGDSIELKEFDEKLDEMRLDRFLSHHEKQLQTAESTWSRQKAVALAGRTLGLLSGFDCNGFLCAGGYWFRKPWFRDAFESIYFNFPLFHEYRKRLLKNCITIGLRAQENALTPILLGSGEKCFDATLLCLLSSLKYLEYEEDELLFEKTRQKLSQLIESLSSEGAERSVKLLENGLVSCQANYSWIDSKIVAEGGKAISSRIPASWNPDSQRFLLIEVNALWVKLLREAEKALPSEERERISQLKALAEGGFRKVFLSQEFPPQIVSEDCLMKSSGLNSPAIEALSLVGDLAPPGYLENALEQIQPSLVNRSGKLFGIQTINEGPEVFHGDPEYHRRVVWPRESVHLINFLKLLGKKELVEEILLSNLEHSAEEGAVFYSQELFALPSGNNNRPSPNSGNPVPVKNPIQLWSQFVYPYFEFLES